MSKRGRVATARIDLNRIGDVASAPEIIKISAAEKWDLSGDKAMASVKAYRTRKNLVVTGQRRNHGHH